MIGTIIMGALLTVVVGGTLPHTSDTYLCYPRDLAAGPLAVAEAGHYAVWAYASANLDSGVEVSGERFTFASERARETQEMPVWRELGKTTLQGGETAVACEPGILLIALSKRAGFSPEKALGDMLALPAGGHVRDRRADLDRETNTVFTMPHFESREAWEAGAAVWRRRILLGAGLYPPPEKTPLKARIFDETTYDDYAVSKVHFEAWPGFLVTGNLYRPLGDGPWPGVLNPHGHWEHGRLEDSERGSVPARCITLARMGAVAFTYDMIGYVDSRQTTHNWGRNHEKLWGVHTFAAQLWSSIRAVDFLEILPYVDAERIGCTGASGGGTQTFALTAVEPRIRVSSPVNMISSTMQGGCLCENAPILRLNNSNMEIGALAAPRPLLLVSATGDWTRETPRVEFPAIRSIYELYGAADKVANVHLDYGHNYNQPSREAMYRFIGKHLLGGDWEDFVEPEYVMPDEATLRVFPDDALPEAFPGSGELVKTLVNQARERRIERLALATQDGERFQREYQGLFADLLGVSIPHGSDLDATRISIEWRDEYILERWVFGRAAVGDRIPALLYRSRDAAPQDAVVMVHGRGKAFLADVMGGPGPLVRAALDLGKAVLLIDAFLTGEHHGPDQLRTHVRVDKFHDTFHLTDTAHRVQDILTSLAFLRGRYDMTGILDLVGLEDASVWAIVAGAIDGDLRRILSDLNQVNLAEDAPWLNIWYMPGVRAVGDAPAAIAASGAERFFLFNADDSGELAGAGATLHPGALAPAALTTIIR